METLARNGFKKNFKNIISTCPTCLVFLCFQGILKEISGMKWVNNYHFKRGSQTKNLVTSHIKCNFKE